jgi:hypothetical protein
MVRSAAFLLLCAPLTLLAQTTEIWTGGLLLHPQAICGPIRMQARMLDTSLDRPFEPHQKVGITMNNLKSAPITLERITFHFAVETSTSGNQSGGWRKAGSFFC